MTVPESKPGVALLIDFENLAIASADAREPFDVWKVVAIAGEYGDPSVRRAYGDWRNYNPYEYKLISNNIDLVQVYSRGVRGKNGADIRLAVDAMEVLFTRPHVRTFVIAGSDSDYTGLVLKLREHGRYVVGVGTRGAHSEHMRAACHEYLFYGRPGSESSIRAVPRGLDELRPVLGETLKSLAAQGAGAPYAPDKLADELAKRDPAFSPRDFGYDSPSAVFEALRDVVDVRRDDTGAQLVYPVHGEGGDPDPAAVEGDAKDPAFWARLLKERYNVVLVERDKFIKLLDFYWYAYRSERWGQPSKFRLEEILMSSDHDPALAEWRDIELEDLRRVDQLLYTARVFYFPNRDSMRPAPRMSDPRTLHIRIGAKEDLLREVNVAVLSRLATEHFARSLRPEEDMLRAFATAPEAAGFTDEQWRDLYTEAVVNSRRHLAKTSAGA